jgi:hypothetical protein
MKEPRLIKSIVLAADSCRKARYHLQIYELCHGAGYVIAKQSGPAGLMKAEEFWYRPSLELAEKKYTDIIHAKTGRKTGRQYSEVYSETSKGPFMCLDKSFE